MVSSGTYDFNPSLGDITLQAFNLAGVRPTSLTQEHMVSSRMAANLMLADWSNVGPNLWKVDLVEETLVEGQASYDVDPKTIVMLDSYIRIDNGVSPPIDRIITPISRSEYASYPNKEQQGFPSVYWYNRQINPVVTLYQVPDGVSAQFLRYYRVTQVEDAEFDAGQTVDIPYRWLSAFTNGLALELARIWSPSLVAGIAPFAERSYKRAFDQDVETAGFYVSPMLSGYYRP